MAGLDFLFDGLGDVAGGIQQVTPVAQGIGKIIDMIRGPESDRAYKQASAIQQEPASPEAES